MINNFRYFLYLLDSNLKKQLVLNIFGFFLVMILEIFSIALIFPAIGFLLNEDISESNPFMKTDLAKFVFVMFRDFEIKELIIFFLIFFGLIYVLKIGISLFFAWKNAKFAFNVRTLLAIKLNKLFINQPFSYHTSINSSKIIHNLTQEISIIAQGCNSLMIFLTEVTVLIGLLCFFIYYQPLLTFVLIIIMLPAIYFFKNLKNFVNKLSKLRQHYDQKTMFFISQTFSGLKELILLDKAKAYSGKYEHNVFESSAANIKNSFITHLPRNVLEIFLILGIILMTLSLPLEQNSFKSELLKLMAILAIISFRIIPALTRIVTATNVLSFMQPVLRTYYLLYKELKKNETPIKSRKEIKFDTIEIKNLSFAYKKKKIIKNFSFSIKKNDTIGIVGKSGSGKTTLVNLFLSLLKPKSGSIDLFKENKKISSIDNLKLSHVPQDVFLFDDSLINNICIPGNNKIDFKLFEKVIRSTDLNDFVKKLPKGIHTNLGERGSKVSGGQKQRIGLARSLYSNTDLIILDEITSALDLKTEKKIINLISKFKNKTIIMITHKKNHLKICNKIIDFNKLSPK